MPPPRPPQHPHSPPPPGAAHSGQAPAASQWQDHVLRTTKERKSQTGRKGYLFVSHVKQETVSSCDCVGKGNLPESLVVSQKQSQKMPEENQCFLHPRHVFIHCYCPPHGDVSTFKVITYHLSATCPVPGNGAPCPHTAITPTFLKLNV